MKVQSIQKLIPMVFALAVSQSAYAESITPESSVKNNTLEPRSVAKKNRQGIRKLDMSNKSHYQFVKSRLRRANIHQDKFPQLHRTLDEQRELKLIEKQYADSTQVIDTTSSVTTENTDVINNAHFFLDRQVVLDDNQVPHLMVSASSAVVGGTNFTYVDLFLESQDFSQIAPIGSAYSMLAGTGDLAVAMIPLATLRKTHPDLETILASSYIETEESNGTISMAVKYTQYPFSWEAIDQQLSELTNTTAKQAQVTTNQITTNMIGRPLKFTYAATDPVDGKTSAPDGVIKVCLNRSRADCDYPWDQAGQTNQQTALKIPFKGSLTTPHRITSIVPGGGLEVDEKTNIYVQEKVNGSTTPLKYKGLNNLNKSFADYITIQPNANGSSTLSWDIPREEGHFGNALLFSRFENVHWHMTFVINAIPYYREESTLIPSVYQMTLTSQANDLNSGRIAIFPKLKPMMFAYSCLAKGTLITMADGSQKPIDKILAGESVRGSLAQNPATAQPMKVVDVSIGIENVDMIRIKGSRKSDILMTETHPISTSNRGIIWAKELQPGDRIFTEKGSIVVKSVTTERYDDNVYNLKLESESFQPGRDLGMFANGLLVGDLATQDQHNYKDHEARQSPAEMLQKLDPKWKTDYLNSLQLNKQ